MRDNAPSAKRTERISDDWPPPYTHPDDERAAVGSLAPPLPPVSTDGPAPPVAPPVPGAPPVGVPAAPPVAALSAGRSAGAAASAVTVAPASTEPPRICCFQTAKVVVAISIRPAVGVTCVPARAPVSWL